MGIGYCDVDRSSPPLQSLEVIHIHARADAELESSILRYHALIPDFLLPYIIYMGEKCADTNYRFRFITSSLSLGEDQ